MNCRRFERQTADWVSRRLSPKCAEEMEAHQKTCDACARAALAERELGERWRGGVESSVTPDLSTPDLWPRLAQRLEEAGQNKARKPWGAGRPRWALAAVLTLAALGVCQWNRLPAGRTGTGSSATERAGAATVRSHAESWSALGKTAQEDPAVDDPVGTSMEPLWTYLKTDSK
jgi:anti-sigma factor RsiW